ncbi:kinase-like domain-containing protein [Epithele typhae]|uniref:kinase-like domain-containing protein n=1 Tax=Epithele typhae TaxID=378194 RepID=UPI0020081A79|nr:kinase-like domain-containing protein [Epithele typhae]KAH9917386.1 kinase-like domain-containing protein [Epithele typhae]
MSGLDPSLCDGDEGCGRIFLQKTTPGLCTLCARKQQHQLSGDTETPEAFSFPQCEQCGRLYRNTSSNLTPLASKAVSITLREQEKPHSVQFYRSASQANTSSPMTSQMPPPLPPDVSGARTSLAPLPYRPRNIPKPSQPAQFVSTSSAHYSDTTRRIFVTLKPTFHPGAAGRMMTSTLAPVSQNWPHNTLMHDALERWNQAKWANTASHRLATATEALSVGEFFDAHFISPHRELFFPSGSSSRKSGRGNTLDLEAYIDIAAFEKRTGSTAPDGLSTKKGGRKRAHESTEGVSEFSGTRTSSKRSKGPRMQSEFSSSLAFGRTMPQSAASSLSALQTTSGTRSEDVLFYLGRLHSETGTGGISITWDDIPTTGSIATQYSASGKTKRVYTLSLSEANIIVRYVAKRFFNFGPDQKTVSLEEHSSYLELEARRLVLGQFFLKNFYETADSNGVDVDFGFAFSGCLLAEEIIVDGSPSVASGVTSEKWADEPKPRLLWLLEPIRPGGEPKRWSGTLVHRNNESLSSMTMEAFTHFTYEYSNGNVVIADLQSVHGLFNEQALTPKATSGQILFDPMTHTPERDTGIGDCGVDGMDAFLEQHECNRLCDALGLNLLPSSHLLSPNTPAPRARKGKGKQVDRFADEYWVEPVDNDNIAEGGGDKEPEVQEKITLDETETEESSRENAVEENGSDDD